LKSINKHRYARVKEIAVAIRPSEARGLIARLDRQYGRLEARRIVNMLCVAGVGQGSIMNMTEALAIPPDELRRSFRRRPRGT
jgi:hypothetical protein